jgi:hypothetical protein
VNEKTTEGSARRRVVRACRRYRRLARREAHASEGGRRKRQRAGIFWLVDGGSADSAILQFQGRQLERMVRPC